MGIVLVSGVLSAHFMPEKGMNLISFKKADSEVIAQETRTLFEERYAGLGAMIGPHFHQRPVETLPPWPDAMLFPHLKYMKGDPFSHGIGRYAPWKVVAQTPCSLRATLCGEDRWQGFLLKELEGYDFQMMYEAVLTEAGLEISLSVTAPRPSLIGLHTYYALPGKGKITSCVKPEYNEGGVFKPIPATWDYQGGQLTFPLPQVADYGFIAAPNAEHGTVLLQTASQGVRIEYWGKESAWQLWHPEGGTFVCIEPLSVRNPRRLEKCASHLKVLISIENSCNASDFLVR